MNRTTHCATLGCMVWLFATNASAQTDLKAKGKAGAKTGDAKAAIEAAADSKSSDDAEASATEEEPSATAADDGEADAPTSSEEKDDSSKAATATAEKNTADSSLEEQSAADSDAPSPPSPVARANATIELYAGPMGGLYGNSKTASVPGIANGSLVQGNDGLQMNFRKTGLLISGDTWIDTGYRQLTNSDLPDRSRFEQQGRVLVRLTPTFTSGQWFTQAQAEVLARAEQLAGASPLFDTDDAFVRVGVWDAFDVQLGRFEAWEVYHKGLGLERDTYEALGAQSGAAGYTVDDVARRSGVGQLAIHAYPADWIRAELAAVVGNTERGDEAAGKNQVGLRTAVIGDFDAVRVKLGAEGKTEYNASDDPTVKDKRDSYGAGGSLQLVLPPHVEAGVNGALGRVDALDVSGLADHVNSTQTLSFGGFANVNFGFLGEALSGLVLGGGANFTLVTNDDCNVKTITNAEGQPIIVGGQALATPDRCGSNAHNQFYAALQQDVFAHSTIKIVGSFATATINRQAEEAVVNSLDERNTMFNVRLRYLVWY